MAYTMNISISGKESAPIQNYFKKNPDVCPSKLVRRLLILHIAQTSPELISTDEVKHEKKHTMDDYAQALKDVVSSKGRVGKDKIPALLAKNLGVSTKIAEDKWRALDKLLPEYGMENHFGMVRLKE